MIKEINDYDGLGLSSIQERLPKCQCKQKAHVIHSVYNLAIMSCIKLN